MNGRNNAKNNGPFIQGSNTDAFNDQLIYITASELIQVVEKRVGNELRTIVQNYYDSNGYFPYPDRYDDSDCLDIGSSGYSSNCESDENVCRGRFPDTALPKDWKGSNLLPGWFSFNLWGQSIYYSVGTDSLKKVPAGCSSGELTVGSANYKSVFIMPGAPLGAVVRNKPPQSLNLSAYYEDAENQDGWSSSANDVYVMPSASSNDKIFVFP
jgi:hypothetical protein